MNFMNYIGDIKTQRTIFPSRPARPLRQSLRRNTTRADAAPKAGDTEYGYVVIGARKLPVRKPESRRVVASACVDTAVADRPLANARFAAPNHEIIEDLFREARDGKFDSFSRRLRGIIQRFPSVDDAVQDTSNVPIASDPLAAARQRGADYALGEWQKPENLTLQAVDKSKIG